jgi:ribosome-associated translation inhibitor RaiA
MTLVVRKIEILGAQRQPALQALVRRRLGTVLRRVPGRPYGARVTFFDDNGPKGGLGCRCAITVQMPDRPARRIECIADTRRSAFDEAIARVDRQLRRSRERARDNRRHPKKYFAAAQLSGETSARPRRRAAP